MHILTFNKFKRIWFFCAPVASAAILICGLLVSIDAISMICLNFSFIFVWYSIFWIVSIYKSSVLRDASEEGFDELCYLCKSPEERSALYPIFNRGDGKLAGAAFLDSDIDKKNVGLALIAAWIVRHRRKYNPFVISDIYNQIGQTDPYYFREAIISDMLDILKEKTEFSEKHKQDFVKSYENRVRLNLRQIAILPDVMNRAH